MTIAIGARFEGGAAICADTKVLASDGATTDDSKVFVAITARRLYAIADASEDAYAAKMLAWEISNAISSAEEPFSIGKTVRGVMQPWYNSYHHVQPPQVQFILTFTQQGWDGANVFYCEPPSTVTRRSPLAIGKGSRAVEPALDVFWSLPRQKHLDAKSALLKMAYLMHLAKRNEGSACGGETNAFVITANGSIALVEEKEMKEAEQVALELDSVIARGVRCLTSLASDEFMKEFHESFDAVSESYRKLLFPSLNDLEKKMWRESAKK
jgi:20S proteasome alpha/beta subunit